jgi:hypothetical protein
MAAYIVAQLDVKNTNWQKEYGPKAGALVHKHGGKVIAGAGYALERLEGQAPLPSVLFILGCPLCGASQSLVPRSGVCAHDSITADRSGCEHLPLNRILFSTASTALTVSVMVTLIALAVFGVYHKSRFPGTAPRRSAIHTVLIGGLAATVAFLLARAIS